MPLVCNLLIEQMSHDGITKQSSPLLKLEIGSSHVIYKSIRKTISEAMNMLHQLVLSAVKPNEA